MAAELDDWIDEPIQVEFAPNSEFQEKLHSTLEGADDRGIVVGYLHESDLPDPKMMFIPWHRIERIHLLTPYELEDPPVESPGGSLWPPPPEETALIYYVVLDENQNVVAEEINLNEISAPEEGDRVEFPEDIRRLFSLPQQTYEVSEVCRVERFTQPKSVYGEGGRVRHCVEVTVAPASLK